jgi:hypothetical protein
MRELAEMMNGNKKGMTDDHKAESNYALKAWHNKPMGMNRKDGIINLTAQTRIRAEESVRLHKSSGHMGMTAMHEDLGHELFNTHSTSRDMMKNRFTITRQDEDMIKIEGARMATEAFENCNDNGEKVTETDDEMDRMNKITINEDEEINHDDENKMDMFKDQVRESYVIAKESKGRDVRRSTRNMKTFFTILKTYAMLPVITSVLKTRHNAENARTSVNANKRRHVKETKQEQDLKIRRIGDDWYGEMKKDGPIISKAFIIELGKKFELYTTDVDNLGIGGTSRNESYAQTEATTLAIHN